VFKVRGHNREGEGCIECDGELRESAQGDHVLFLCCCIIRIPRLIHWKLSRVAQVVLWRWIVEGCEAETIVFRIPDDFKRGWSKCSDDVHVWGASAAFRA
jgi:hypothetical protein